MHIKADRFRLYEKILLTVLFFWFLFIIPSLLGSVPQKTGIKAMFFSLGLLAMIGIIYAIFQMIIFPVGIYINEDLNKIKINFLLKKSLFINTDVIESYSLITGMRSGYQGVSINLKNGVKILCSTFTLSEFQPIVDFFKKINIPYNGSEKYRFLKFFKFR